MSCEDSLRIQTICKETAPKIIDTTLYNQPKAKIPQRDSCLTQRDASYTWNDCQLHTCHFQSC